MLWTAFFPAKNIGTIVTIFCSIIRVIANTNRIVRSTAFEELGKSNFSDLYLHRIVDVIVGLPAPFLFIPDFQATLGEAGEVYSEKKETMVESALSHTTERTPQ